MFPGAGSTEINSSDETTINVGDYNSGYGTIIPTVKVNPTAFSPSENDIITVSMSYGTTPEEPSITLFLITLQSAMEHLFFPTAD